MEHAFSFPIMAGEAEVGLVEGVAVIEPDRIDASEWAITGIVLDGSVPNPRHALDKDQPMFAMVDVALAETHWLYPRIKLWLLQERREAIDYEWDRRDRRAA